VARAIQGIGGGIVPLSFGIVRDEFPAAKVSSGIGAMSSLTGIGAAIGIVLAGPIVALLDFHWLFWLPMIGTTLAAIVAHFVVPESPALGGRRVSWLPPILLSAWLVALLVPLTEASSWGWGSPKTVGLFAVAIVLALGWIIAEQRARTPLVDMTMMRLRAVWTNNLVSLMLGLALFGVFAFLPQFVQTPVSSGYGFGSSITQSGLILLPASSTMFLSSLYSGRAAARFGGRNVVIFGPLVGLVAMLMLAFAHGHVWELLVATGIFGSGFGLAFAAMSNLVVNAVPQSQTGVASGMNANIRTIGGSLGAALLATIVTSQIGSDGLPKEIGYTIGFTSLAGAMLLAAVAAVLIPKPGARRIIELSPEPSLTVRTAGTQVGDARA
jgi:MFS family permease